MSDRDSTGSGRHTAHNSRQIIISGAGIAGLTAALSLVRRGWRVTVLEKRNQPAEIGAGVQLSPNANSVFAELGLLQEIGRVASAPGAVELRNGKNDRPLSSLPIQHHAQATYGHPYYVVHRADLLDVLLRAVKQHDEIILQTGHETIDVANYPAGVTVLSIADQAHHEHTGRALIVAEGVFSPTRQVLGGAERAEHAGKIAWRSLIDCEPNDHLQHLGAHTIAWLSHRSHLVCYPVRGGSQLNLVAFTNGKETEKSWSLAADAADLREVFSRWSPPVRALVDRAESWTRWPVYAIKNKAEWVNGNVALIGDAAHAMEPFLAQGAAMAIEDAAVLGALLHPESDIADGLLQWQRQRWRRVRKVAKQAHDAGEIYHFGPGLASCRNIALRLTPARRLLRRYDWINRWQSPTIPEDYDKIFLQ